MPDMNLMLQYEEGCIDYPGFVELFQQIYDTQAYRWLQGHYGRTCAALLEEGVIQ